MLLLLSSFIFKNIKRLQYFLPDGQKSKDLKSERKKRIFIKKKKESLLQNEYSFFPSPSCWGVNSTKWVLWFQKGQENKNYNNDEKIDAEDTTDAEDTPRTIKCSWLKLKTDNWPSCETSINKTSGPCSGPG